MTTPPKQSLVLALTYPVVFLAGALLVGTLASGWLFGDEAQSSPGAADVAEP
jgi:hypothetical protein